MQYNVLSKVVVKARDIERHLLFPKVAKLLMQENNFSKRDRLLRIKYIPYVTVNLIKNLNLIIFKIISGGVHVCYLKERTQNHIFL